jgi:hypothetical protein
VSFTASACCLLLEWRGGRCVARGVVGVGAAAEEEGTWFCAGVVWKLRVVVRCSADLMLLFPTGKRRAEVKSGNRSDEAVNMQDSA